MSQTEEKITLTVKLGEEVKVPSRGPFSSFPKLRVVGVTRYGQEFKTEYWPTTGSLPSNIHSKTVRLINLEWNGTRAKLEYDDTSKNIKFLSGNVESVNVEIK